MNQSPDVYLDHTKPICFGTRRTTIIEVGPDRFKVTSTSRSNLREIGFYKLTEKIVSAAEAEKIKEGELANDLGMHDNIDL